jgi:capsular exopolysaccharide synthesis family protein
MPLYDFKVTDFERIFRKGYRIIIGTVVAALILSFVIVKMKPLNYRASSIIKYDTQSMLSGLGNEVSMMAYDYLDNITKVADDITSYPILLRAAQKLDLINDTVSADIRHSTDSINTILQRLSAQISAVTNASNNSITIIVHSGSPKQARDLANAVTYAFKECSFERKKTQVLKTKKFIQSQLDRIQGELSDVETDLVDFEERRHLPSISANTNKIISHSDELKDHIDEIDNSIKTIAQQQRQLLSGAKIVAPDSAQADGKNHFIWLSESIENDPGLVQLNNRLINQQIERDNQLAYYKPDHPVMRALAASIDETVKRLSTQLEKKRLSLQEKKQTLFQHRQQVDNEIRSIPRNEIDYLRLKRRQNVKEEIYTMFSKRLQEANIAEAGIIDDIVIVGLAKLPDRPVNDDLFIALGIGLLIGLIVGILAVIMRELFDTSIGTIEDVEQSMKLPVIGVIPQLYAPHKKMSFGGDHRQPPPMWSLVTHFNPKDFCAEAFRILRTNVDFFCLEKQYKTFLFTSSSISEGKSTVTANLSIVFAQQGKKILLLDADLRRPSLESLFGVTRGPGISDILIEKLTWEKCILTVTDLALGSMRLEDIIATPGLQNFYFIPHGHAPTNPTELLSSVRMTQLLKTLREEFDLIFIDAPPVLPVADAIVLSKQVDGVILVYKVGSVPKKMFQLCKERLEAVQANMLGVVLNGLKPESADAPYMKYNAKAFKQEHVKS